MSRRVPPAHMATEIVLVRVSSALGDASKELAALEAALIRHEGGCASERLQAFDSIGQQLRALALFLSVASETAEGEIGVSEALEAVWLEALRARLAGEETKAPQLDIDIW